MDRLTHFPTACGQDDLTAVPGEYSSATQTDSLGTAPKDDIITQGVDFGLDVKEVEEILETLKNEGKIAHLAGEESFERI